MKRIFWHYLSIAVLMAVAVGLFLSACSSSGNSTSRNAANDALTTLRNMAAESDPTFFGYESAGDVGSETLGEPFRIKTLDFDPLLARDVATDSMIIDGNEYIFPVIIRSAAIEGIRVMEKGGEWEYLSMESKDEIEKAQQLITANSLIRNDCFLLELELVELVFVGYKSNGVIMLIPLYDSASPLLVAGTKYLFTDIAAQIKREVQTARDEYHDMIPPVSGDTSAPKPTAAASSTPLKATGKASKILGVSLSAQEQDEWCWAASGRMTMLFLGGDLGKITQCEQANTAQSQTKCCTDGSSAACNKPHYPEYDKWGFTAQYSDSATPPSWELLKGSIDGGKPLAFGWQWNAGGGHMMVAVGYYEDASTTPAKRMVNVYDPWPVNVGKKQSMTYSAWTGGEDYKWGGYFYNITKDVKKTAVKERISRLHVGEQIQVKRLMQGKQLLARVGQIPT